MQKILQKYHLNTILEALLHPPKTYQNLLLCTSLENLPLQGVFQVKIISHIQTQKTLKISATLTSFNQPLEITIFHPKAFHKFLFPINSTLYIYGILEKRMTLEMIQPKVVKEVGKIIPIFEKNTKGMMNDLLALITPDILLSSHIPKDLVTYLVEIFHPNQNFFNLFTLHRSLPPQHLKALKFVEIFVYLLELDKKRLVYPSKKQCHGDLDLFISSLPFPLTNGQKKALEEIRGDFLSPTASKRMIMGDVGCGKTMVIFGAVVLAYPHKSILMVPTTVLAKQIYNQAIKFLPPQIRIGLFSKDTKNKKENYENFDFVIGTQTLIHREDDLKDFALIMCDEQHRFGTQQRFFLEKLATQEKTKPHILQFSATPIPRTMAMIQTNLISHTFITDTPFPKNITTTILYKDHWNMLLAHIKKEISLNHQIAIVYPLVKESKNSAYRPLEEGEKLWKKYFDGVFCTNGGDKEKEKVIEEFQEKGNILLATTLIEVGISLPRLSTIVIVGAERMGLATLHQLRGRVSRNGLQGYCFLFTHSKENQRLKDFTQTTNGFEIAELDLKYRKSGDLFDGERQSGREFKFFDLSEDEEIAKSAKEILELSKKPKKQDIINSL